ncbi:MAG: phenylalanine--tRNA ligase subunit alpha, partial [Chthoniobacterales bacterium]
MTHALEELRLSALSEISHAADEQALEIVRVRYLGRAGSISAWADRMKSLSKEERPLIGKLLNESRNAVTAAIQETAERLRAAKESSELANLDISLPGTAAELGTLHPLTQMLDRGIGIFRRMGFALA